MIEILRSGGDIHSRTAYKMFPEVSQAVDSGSVVLDESPSCKHHFHILLRPPQPPKKGAVPPRNPLRSEKKQGTLVKEH